jgi:hypothetical protein
VAEKPKRSRKPKAAAPAPTAAEEGETAAAPAAPAAPAAAADKPKKSIKKAAANAVAVDTTSTNVEWIQFFYEGRPLIRHAITHNVYEVDSSKALPEEMKRDFVGKWHDSKLDPYAEEDETA